MNFILIVILLLIINVYMENNNHIINFKKGALLLDISGSIVDKPEINNTFPYISKEIFIDNIKKEQENSLFDLVNKLRTAKEDQSITGIVLSLKDLTWASYDSLQYIGKAIKEFKASGKPVYAIGDNYTQEQYFLASYANEIYISPHGTVNLYGLSINNVYYKKLLEKLKVNSHVFRVGDYKSAVEPIIRNNMSEKARMDNQRWINQIWNFYLNEISKNRSISISQVFPGAEKIIQNLNKFKYDTAKLALMNKLVDKILPRYNINNHLIKIFGFDKNKNTYNHVSIYNYNNKSNIKQENKIAVIVVNGVIIEGTDKPGFVGSENIANQIRDAKSNPKIKSIVLRINSPGGSVNGSEIIRTELHAAKLAGKYIVVSMGNIAASGGYWISTPAHYIISNETTLTGSIGIFGVIHTLENSLNAIGVNIDGISTSPLSGMSISKPLSPEIEKIIQLNVENGYRNFIKLVYESRYKKISDINKISQGRIWTGLDAIKNGLVDQIGDFDDAVIKAASLAKINKYQLYWHVEDKTNIFKSWIYPNIYYNSIVDYLIFKFFNINKTKYFSHEDFYKLIYNDPNNIYAFCTYCLS